MGVVSRRWVWLLGVVVRRYIDFIILLIPTPLVLFFFTAASLLFVHFLNVFRSLYNDYAVLLLLCFTKCTTIIAFSNH